MLGFLPGEFITLFPFYDFNGDIGLTLKKTSSRRHKSTVDEMGLPTCVPLFSGEGSDVTRDCRSTGLVRRLTVVGLSN